uniref:Ferredoxin-thioredoxin reductase catalytic chain, chloroplastic n=1 Tax=Cannabis sativa TaxID=3483 RepID=A0A803PJY7_CANSA
MTLQASSCFTVAIPSFALPTSRSRRGCVIRAKVEPSEKSVELMRKFSEQYARRSGTYFCVDKGVTSVVIKGLADHKDQLGAPLCPCRHYDDKAAEVGQGFWNCPCVPMRERKECHCMLFLTSDNDFAGQEQAITLEEIKESTANIPYLTPALRSTTLETHSYRRFNNTIEMKGRNIQDNNVIVQEIIHSFNRKTCKESFFVITIDIVKAYDKISWQGDPFSPYLFIWVAQMLSRLLEDALGIGDIRGISLSRGGPTLSHIFFADDLILVKRATWGKLKATDNALRDVSPGPNNKSINSKLRFSLVKILMKE